MWSDGGVEGLKEPLFGGGAAPREAARHLWGSSSRLLDQTPDDQVSSSTSPSQEEAAVDLSLKSQVENCEAVEGRRPSLQSTGLEKAMKGKSVNYAKCGTDTRRISSDDESGRLVIAEPPPVPESSGSPTPPPSSVHSFTPAQTERSSIKDVLLEMTNRKNGHNKLAPARWGIMKKDLDQVPKYIDEKKGAFPRPTALVNPFPADISPPNGSATHQTSIKDWLHGSKEISPREINKTCTVQKISKTAMRQRTPRGSNGKITMPRKKPLTTIVAQLTGTVQCSQSTQSDSAILHTFLGPTESVSYASPHRLSGGEVSISEVTPDLSVVDRLKKLGTVIEIEEKAENNSLKLLEKMTKSVATDAERPKTPNNQSPTVPPNKTTLSSKPPLQQNIKQLETSKKKQNSPKTLPLNHLPLNHQIISQASKISLAQVPSEHTQHAPEPIEQNHSVKLPSTSGSQDSSDQFIKEKSSHVNQSTYQMPSSSTASKMFSSSVSPKVQSPNQNVTVKPISLTPKIQFSTQKISKKSNSTKAASKNTGTKHQKSKLQEGSQSSLKHFSNMSNDTSHVVPVSALETTYYISKDVTLIPKLPIESVHDKINFVKPSLLEPEIDIVEEENILSPDGTFLFKTDSFFSVDLPNEQKVFSCDICSAVYNHSNMLRKHYLRLHISRKYISERDMETFNIDPEPFSENKEEKLIFRCHTCRQCFLTKNDLRSHLTDHPPVVELSKQSNKSHPTYKCENCSTMFKWRKQFGKHKKTCKPPPPPPPEKPDLFHCLYCNETFLNGNSKRNHILSNHPYVRRKHCCVFCKKDGFPTNVSLFLHLLSDHPSVYFACQICRERFTTLEELKSHVEKKHDQDDKLKSSLSERVSSLKQEKDYYSCDTCQRKFLIEISFKEHKCFPEKQEKPKPKLQKIKKKVYPLSERMEKNSHRNIDLETLFYSRVASNVRENLLNHLDGKIYKDDSSEQDETYGAPSPNVSTRTFLNFSASFPSSSEIQMDLSGAETPTRVKAPWEKYTFPKNYDGRCGLTSYIKDTSYLDISTQLIMRRNLQRLNMLPMKESPSDDVPSVLALERLGAECAESFGQLKIEKKEDDGEDKQEQELISLSGEWVRERMYVCSACRWESPCLWTMEDHKYLAHPRVHCPQHELIGEQTSLSKTIYKRLITEVPNPYKGPAPPTPPSLLNISCTKCSKAGFSNQTELHVHILECAGVVVEAIGPIGSSRRRRRRTRRRPRRGLKRNIPSTPQKLPPKQRTKPGDTDTIQRMIANLPAKRVSRKVFSGFDEEKARQNIHKNATIKGGKNKKSPGGKRSHSEPPRTPIKEEEPEQQVMLQSPKVIKKEQDYIDTSAEGGDVLSSLRMMPVRAARASSTNISELVQSDNVDDKKDINILAQPDDKEMPKLEIEKDISPVESSEIPVLSPVERKDEIKKEKDDLICGISFVDGLIKYETVSSVSQETEKLDERLNQRKRKSSASNQSSNMPKAKKSCKGKDEVLNDTKPIINIVVLNDLPQKDVAPVIQPLSKKINSQKESIDKKEVKQKRPSTPKEKPGRKETPTRTAAIKKVATNTKNTSKRKSLPIDGEDTSIKEIIVNKDVPLKNNINKKNIPKKGKAKDDSQKEAVIKKNLSPKEEMIKEETKESPGNENTKDISPKRRGRPKGSLTRKSIIPEKRRSNRRSNKNDSIEIKFDEILPFEEDEVELVKTPAKPKRKPRTIKKEETPDVDLTTIVVQAEVHPPPAVKRKLTEIYPEEVLNSEDVLSSKKIKESPINSSSYENDLQVEVSCHTTDIEIPEDNIKLNDSLNSSLESDISKVEPDTSVMDDRDIIAQEKQTSQEKTQIVECEESAVTTSVSDSQLEVHLNEDQKINEIQNEVISSEKEVLANENEIIACGKDVILSEKEVNDCEKEVTGSEKEEIGSEKEVIDSGKELIDSEKEAIGIKKEVNCVESSVNGIEITETKNELLKTVTDKSCSEVLPEEDTSGTKKNANSNSVENSINEEKDNHCHNEKIDINFENDSISSVNSLLEEKKPCKKKKNIKKVLIKTKKKRKDCQQGEYESIGDESEKMTDIILSSEKVNEIEKPKKAKKSLKKEICEISDAKKLKSTVKKKKIIKKIVKMKKRFPSKTYSDSPSGEVLSVAGFKWEVSTLESLPTVDSSAAESESIQSLPDSSVQEPLPLPDPKVEAQIHDQELLLAPPPPQLVQPSTGVPHFNSLTEPTSSSTTNSIAPISRPPSSLPTPSQSWEPATPWEPPTPDPSLGTIIDSVNKLLNEPESTYTPLGLPSYSLADLQKAMGASDDEMAVLQQLGEASLQITSSDGPCTGSVKGCEGDDWNGEKCIMDLDSQSTLQKQPEPPQPLFPELSNEPPDVKAPQELRSREKSPTLGSSSLLEAHQGKEVLCPSCSCHFMGFPALQRHLAKAHPSVGPKSKQKRGAGTPFTKTDLNRRMPLDSSQSPRLVCFSCQQILPADRMSLHLEQEHAISPEDVSKCSTLSGESHDGPVLGERLKSKMSSKLGDLLDRAVNNLLQAKHKPNNTLHGARELLSKLQRQQDQKSLDESAEDSTKVLKTAAKLFSCSICGLKFALPSSRNKHEVLAHRSFRPAEYELDEYENDWREAPSPPEIKGENGAETEICPQCSDCGLSFDSIQEVMKHRLEDHSTRRSSVDASNTNTGCCPSPVPSSVDSRSLPDSEAEVGGGDSDAGGSGPRRSTRKLRLSQSGSKSVKERAEAALRELNHPRQRTDKRWIAALKQKAADIYNFTDESL